MASALEPESRRRGLEQEWFIRLKHAEAAWLSACRDYELVCASEGDIDSAYTAKLDALVEYKRVLRIFTDLVVDRKAPLEEA